MSPNAGTQRDSSRRFWLGDGIDSSWSAVWPCRERGGSLERTRNQREQWTYTRRLDMKRGAMVEMAVFLVTALRTRRLGPRDHSTRTHVDENITRTMLHVLQGACTVPSRELLISTGRAIPSRTSQTTLARTWTSGASETATGTRCTCTTRTGGSHRQIRWH